MDKTLICAALLTLCAASGLPADAAQTGSQRLQSALTIHIKNFMFSPLTAKINAGDRITFINDDAEAHTVTAGDKSFDSEGLDGGAAWQHVFSKPGTYNYFCELHPYMKATVVVAAASGSQR